MVPERTTARANPARGLALIATAVIIGFFLLRNGWDQSVPDVAAADAAETAENGEDAAGGDTSSTTAAAPAARPPSEVIVRVANTTGVNGAGGCMTQQLTTREYQTVEATDAQPPRETTVVQFQAGFEAEAAALLEIMQVESPPEPIDPAVADPGGANLVVLLGSDLATPC